MHRLVGFIEEQHRHDGPEGLRNPVEVSDHAVGLCNAGGRFRGPPLNLGHGLNDLPNRGHLLW